MATLHRFEGSESSEAERLLRDLEAAGDVPFRLTG